MNLNITTMINPKIENAHTELCKAINANRHGLGSEQYTLLINLADTLANEGDEYTTESALMVLKTTSRRLMYLQERLRTDQQLIAAQLKAWNTTE